MEKTFGGKGWAGGVSDTHLGPGNDGFVKEPSHVGAIQEAPEGYTLQVGREETIGPDEMVKAGRGGK